MCFGFGGWVFGVGCFVMFVWCWFGVWGECFNCLFGFGCFEWCFVCVVVGVWVVVLIG